MFGTRHAETLTDAPLEAVKGRSLWQDARGRFLRNKAAVTGLIVLIAMTLFALFGGLLAKYEPDFVDFSLMGANAFRGVPSFETGHYFGVDQDGRDLYARVVQGTGISLLVGVVGAFVAVFVGTLYGAVSGYIGGRTDQIMMRIVDILLSIPFMFVLILMLVIFGRSLLMLFIGIGLISWLNMARIARGQTLTIKNKEFVEAAIASGVPTFTIILRHIVPNLAGIVVVYATLLVPEIILFESFVSYLGLGVQEPNTSLGALINLGARQMNNGTLWMLLFPLAFFLTTLFAFFFVGDGLRDALDPKDR
ncbi:ABC transporter permease subunit [Pseudooctadecabacter jejudonensis]|uniref:Oligopeptide transport system permease protein OppC n=1 Tax=Pseudooctadecabacter jejudonensis TaxID=1391910 RepID=A0A1Y5SN06_9RHOB|nr:ABC transporter permease subunit [Pseudooctadecabacter jejudonensis]SLN43833.1 Oligopeptide transport system permease protein OppC [Pseudooctadecabacter jejudonensis]